MNWLKNLTFKSDLKSKVLRELEETRLNRQDFLANAEYFTSMASMLERREARLVQFLKGATSEENNNQGLRVTAIVR